MPVDYEGNMSSGTVFASKSFMAAHPDAIRRFIAGWLETVAFMRKNKAETVKLTSAMTGFSQAVQAKEYDLTPSMYSDTASSMRNRSAPSSAPLPI